MADELDAFYAELATVEAETAQQTEDAAPALEGTGPIDQQAATHEPASQPALPLPPMPPPPTAPPAGATRLPPPLAPPPRPPPLSRPAIISQNPVIVAPPQPSEYEEPELSAPAGPSLQPPPPPPAGTWQPKPPPGKPAPPGKRVGVVREAAGERWVDPTLTEWPENDFRIFVGNLAPEVTEAMLTQAFSQYETFQKAKVVRNTHNNKSKGFGFVSFGDVKYGAQALKEMHGQYIASRPCQLKRSKAEDRTVKDRKGRAVKRLVTAVPAPPPKRHHPNPNQQQRGGQGGGQGGFFGR